MNGLLLIDKSEGPTSAEVVRRVRRSLGGVRVGHLGTLDPFASGVLPLCVGHGRKIARFFNAADKSYDGVIHMGVAMDTGDRTGTEVRRAAVPPLDEEDLARLVERFTGAYDQVPPMYSALKRDGVPLYRLARRGVTVERPARRVCIRDLALEHAGKERLRFRVSCSKGTYIRVLAEDLAAAVNCVAYVETLRRTRFGDFVVADAVPVEDWTPAETRGFLSIRQALRGVPALTLTPEQVRAVRYGQRQVLCEVRVPQDAELALLVDPRGDVVALVVRRDHGLAFAGIFQQPHS